SQKKAGSDHFQVYFRSRLVSDTVYLYLANIDFACRTLFLARTALSAIFLSQHRSNRLSRIMHGKQSSMRD
ncbi:hypothetical protein, partial [Escherichia coli]|uniref:hypothetical protein n=1 Tax=Escherichia coli TaxID=562 RepID=UPI001953ACDB